MKRSHKWPREEIKLKYVGGQLPVVVGLGYGLQCKVREIRMGKEMKKTNCTVDEEPRCQGHPRNVRRI